MTRRAPRKKGKSSPRSAAPPAKAKAEPRAGKTKIKPKAKRTPKARPLDDALLTTILDFCPAGIAISEAKSGEIVYINPAMGSFFERAPGKSIGLQSGAAAFVDPVDMEKIRGALKENGEFRKFLISAKTTSGEERRATFSCKMIEYQGRRSVLTCLEDDAERNRREQDILSASKRVALLHQIAGISNSAVNFFDALRKATAEIAREVNWPIGLAYRLAHGSDRLLEIASFSFPKDRPDLEALRPELIGKSFNLGEDLPGRVLAERRILWVEDVGAESGMERFSRPTIKSALGIPIFADDRIVAVLELLADRPQPRDEMLELTLAQISSELGRVYLRDLTTMTLQEARAEAESSTRAKASFLAAMSHEVRTPMNGVVGMVDLILQTKLDDDQRFMLQTVMESGRTLIKVINDILDFSKIEAGRLEIERAEFSPLKTVEDVAFSVAPAAKQKGLNLIAYVDPHIPDVVLGDAVRVRQILSNLASNAVKFSERGEVVIKAERQPPAGDQKIRVRFSVRDEGVGISAEGRKRLFEEFQQVDGSTTRKFGGTGLGLAICQRLTALMGGEIGVESLIGVGSEFHCILPFEKAEDKPVHGEGRDLEGLRALVVAESESLREACRSYLSMWKADVVSVSRLRDAAVYAQRTARSAEQIDVIVIPHVDDVKQVAALRQGFIDAGLMPYPRFVIGRAAPEDKAALSQIPEVTLFDVNPVRRVALVFAVAVAAGRASPETPVFEQPEFVATAGPPSVEKALADGQLILVAEDNTANQEVIRRQLNRLGYACEMADDGVQALDMWSSKAYGLLLTDCHMPNMDGFGLTAEIRKREAAPGRRTPIVAITANVLQGEAERCTAAGMDDFLPKPVDLKTLKAMLVKWMGPGAAVPEAADAAAGSDARVGPAEAQVLDLSRVMEVFGEIDDDARAYFGLFLDSVRPLIPAFFEEIGASRFGEARELVHKAKGAAANAGGVEFMSLMHDIEVALAEQRYTHAVNRSQEVRAVWNRLEQAIDRLSHPQAASSAGLKS